MTSGPTNQMNGDIDSVKIYKYPRTQAQIVEDMNSAHPAGGSPIGSQVIKWAFDEGQGTTANNQVSGGTAGTLTNIASPATSTSGWTQTGKTNKAIVFDGSNDAVVIATASDASVDFNGSEPFSVCSYVYPTTMAGSSEADLIVGKWDATTPTRGYRLYLTNDDADTTGNFRAEVYDESADQTISAAGSNDTVSVNESANVENSSKEKIGDFFGNIFTSSELCHDARIILKKIELLNSIWKSMNL
jgi:hypothetical protein